MERMNPTLKLVLGLAVIVLGVSTLVTVLLVGLLGLLPIIGVLVSAAISGYLGYKWADKVLPHLNQPGKDKDDE